MSCPRHPATTGRDDKKVDLGPRIRCDCLELLLSALAPMKMGKWVRVAVPTYLLQDMGDEVEERANRAIHEAILAAYQLGLRGGIEPHLISTCVKCGKPFYTEHALEICGSCLVDCET